MIDDAEATDYLLPGLQSEVGRRRERPARGLARAWGGEPRALRALLRLALSDQYKYVRQAARKALKTMAVSSARPFLGALQDADGPERELILDVVHEAGEDALADLTAALLDERRYVRVDAARALDDLGWQPQTAEDQAAYWIATEQWEACAQSGMDVLDPLVDAVVDGAATDGAVEALAHVGAPAVESLAQLLNDTDRP